MPIQGKLYLWGERAKGVPEETGVYALFDKNRVMIYLGGSLNFRETFSSYVETNFSVDPRKRETVYYRRMSTSNWEESVKSLLDEYKDCVVISPFLPHSKLYSAYSKSFYGLQIFGWDSARFSYGAKPIEQAASGCAILIQKNPDVEDVVIHGKTGFVVENAQDVIEACELAINNPDEVREMGLRAKRFIEEKYGPKVLNEKLQKIWGE